MKLGLTQLAQIAEVIAAVAVVVSLIYVGREVRSNTAAVRGAAMQAIATTDADALLSVASDSALSAIVRVGYVDPSRPSEADAFRFEMFMRQSWLSFQNIYQQASVYKVIELVGTSTESWEKAAAAAVHRASGSLRDMRVAEVAELDMQLKDGAIQAYRAKVKVSFKYEADD